MPALARQRCLLHPVREAVARCPECHQFYCRECIAEHDDRVICAACLQKLNAPASAAPHAGWNLWPAGQIAGGFFIAWLLFYSCGQLLLLIPAEFHDDRLWKAELLKTLSQEAPDDE
ncbi:MAG TPA: rhomboid family protein [Chthoniobacteraceae bacterium]|jgi:hypothetical protein